MDQFKIEKLNLLMEEIQELQLHLRDLRNDNFLLRHDLETISKTKNIQKEKLTKDYFKF